MRLFPKSPKERVLDEDERNKDRRVVVIRRGENSWQIVYADEIADYNGKGGILLSEFLKGTSK